MKKCKRPDSRGLYHCYTEAQTCDGFNDCPDGDDELNCTSCKNGAFHCAQSQRCIASHKRCDGVQDCPDLADELNCTCEGLQDF